MTLQAAAPLDTGRHLSVTSTAQTSLDSIRHLAVVTIPEAGAVLGLSKSAAYRAAEAGQLPTLRLGRRLMVPVPKLLMMLGLDPYPATESA